MRRQSAVRDTLEYWMALAVVESLASTPLPMANWLARRYAGLLDMALPRLRRVALHNLAMALPELDRRAHQRIAEIAYVHRFAVLVDAGRPGDQKHHQAVQVDPHATRERTGPSIIVSLIEHAQVGDGRSEEH